MAAQSGVSHPTIREALKRLAAYHLIRSRRRPADGTFVSGPSPEELAQSFGMAATMLAATGGTLLHGPALWRLELARRRRLSPLT